MLKMRRTNSKPTKQAERCQTLIAEKNMNNWIETSGSPFVIVEQQYAHQWKGQENYNAICSVTDYLGKIYIDNHVLLVMGDEPMATRIVNKDGAILIIRWKYAPDYLTVEKLLENDIVNGIEPIEEVEVKWDSTELVLFDSLSPYCEASVKVFLSLQKTSCIIHSLPDLPQENSGLYSFYHIMMDYESPNIEDWKEYRPNGQSLLLSFDDIVMTRKSR